MKSTIRTEAGSIRIEALTPGKVTLNGRDMLPHEAFLAGAELQRAAAAAAKRAEGYSAQFLAAAKGR
jgi:hypothetical protein